MEGDLSVVETTWYYPPNITNMLLQIKTIKENGYEVENSSRRDKNGIRDLAFYVETKVNIKL